MPFLRRGLILTASFSFLIQPLQHHAATPRPLGCFGVVPSSLPVTSPPTSPSHSYAPTRRLRPPIYCRKMLPAPVHLKLRSQDSQCSMFKYQPRSRGK
ncbi:hypothetical protein C8F04DRAFT_1064149 [Mycena alexandri]|uniref:Secreted protein n=1 Tax=Mycena alexandri TaxID=1745969 RepID=A0AAD6THV9_9AGAR|nr:hypothetical protein C8F04DRAFT_1064149 [Mycena alexandri]